MLSQPSKITTRRWLCPACNRLIAYRKGSHLGRTVRVFRPHKNPAGDWCAHGGTDT